MSTLILGKGYVGTHLARYYRQNNIPVQLVSKADLDYTNKTVFAEFLDKNLDTIRNVINCSGYTGVPNVDACEDNKELCYNYNVLYPLQVVRECHKRKIPVVHVGSGCIYSGYDKEYTEEDVPNFGIYSNESSYYSKCKHIFETVIEDYKCYVLRIRIPFTSDDSRKNYFTKLLKYDTLINELNSITSIEDFNAFVVRLLNKTNTPYGVYNVVNPQPVKAIEIVDMLTVNGLTNPNWKFIQLSELNTKAKRSNCVLSTEKIAKLGLSLPDTKESLKRDIIGLSKS